MSARMVSRGLLRAGVALIALSGPLAAQSMFDADDGMGVQPLTGMPGSMSADSGVTALAPESVALGSAPVADRTPSPQNPMVVGPDALSLIHI